MFVTNLFFDQNIKRTSLRSVPISTFFHMDTDIEANPIPLPIPPPPPHQPSPTTIHVHNAKPYDCISSSDVLIVVSPSSAYNNHGNHPNNNRNRNRNGLTLSQFTEIVSNQNGPPCYATWLICCVYSIFRIELWFCCCFLMLLLIGIIVSLPK